MHVAHTRARYVATWEARLQQLEQAFLQRPGRKPTGRDHEQDSGTQFPSPASPLGTASAFEASPIQVQDVLDDGSPIDAMGAVIFADEPESGFFGASFVSCRGALSPSCEC